MRKRHSEPAVTIWDVARESNVSISTVSHVINNGPQAVRPDTRERVLEVIEKLNYRPNAMARGLARGRMNNIGVLASAFTTQSIFANPYASGIMQGVLDGATALRYDVALFVEPWIDLRQSGPVFRNRRADGILCISPLSDSDMVSGLVSLEIDVIVVSGDCLHLGVPSVDVDNALGARLAADHLIALGHKRIAIVTGDSTLVSSTFLENTSGRLPTKAPAARRPSCRSCASRNPPPRYLRPTTRSPSRWFTWHGTSGSVSRSRSRSSVSTTLLCSTT
jgi:DNA-binding LacI/PurR family transcriptional regulator